MATQGNGGKIYPAQSGFTPEPLIFVEVNAAPPGQFNADLVADPNNPADRIAAVGSGLERLINYMSTFGTILGMATSSGIYLELIFDYGSAFSEVESYLVAANEIDSWPGWGGPGGNIVSGYTTCTPANPAIPT